MSPQRSSAPEPELSRLDAAATLELCATLAEYAEAGALSRELLLRVGSFAEDAFAANLDVLLAVGRLYRLGAELERARATLLRADALAPDDGRATRLLGEVRREPDAPKAAEEVLRAAPTAEPSPSPVVERVEAGPRLPLGVALRTVLDALAELRAAHPLADLARDPREEVFTAGILLWELLAGRALLGSDRVAVSLSRAAPARFPSIRLHVPAVPPAIDAVCQRALHPIPRRRFATAAAMAAALEEAAKSAEIAIASPAEVGRREEVRIEAETPPPAPPPAPEPPPQRVVTPAPAVATPALEIAKAPPALEVAKAPPVAATAPLLDPPPRSRRTLVAVALIVAFGASSPLWMTRVNRALHPAPSSTPQPLRNHP